MRILTILLACAICAQAAAPKLTPDERKQKVHRAIVSEIARERYATDYECETLFAAFDAIKAGDLEAAERLYKEARAAIKERLDEAKAEEILAARKK